MAGHLLAASCVFALLLSALGPAIDHHFAERHPGHAHFYLGPEAPNHRHSYESSARHYHSHDNGYDSPRADGLIFLTAHDQLGQGPGDVASPAVSHSAVFPGPEDNRLSLGSWDGESIPPGALVPPPKPPPRA